MSALFLCALGNPPVSALDDALEGNRTEVDLQTRKVCDPNRMTDLHLANRLVVWLFLSFALISISVSTR